jgi:hypothetical protein
MDMFAIKAMPSVAEIAHHGAKPAPEAQEETMTRLELCAAVERARLRRVEIGLGCVLVIMLAGAFYAVWMVFFRYSRPSPTVRTERHYEVGSAKPPVFNFKATPLAASRLAGMSAGSFAAREQ